MIEATIHDLLNNYPWLYQDEIIDFLYKVFDIKVD
jgi:hypothetical protein